MNLYKRSLLIGMLVGDGCIKIKKYIRKDGTISAQASFVIAHSDKQEEYIRYKAEKFHSIMGGNPIKIYEGFHCNGKYRELRFSKNHKYFRLLHRWAYGVEGKKRFTRNLLDKLTPEGIAYWYMDDGGLNPHHSKVTGKLTSMTLKLFTYCSSEECDIIIKYFAEVHHIKFKKYLHKVTGRYYVGCNTREAIKFENLVRPYIIPSMLYKIEPPDMTRARKGMWNT